MRININEPRWDQNTYIGRAKHFFLLTNPLNIFCTSKDLENAKNIVEKYRKGEDIPGLTEKQLWKAKNIYDSAFHPDTGEKMLLIGRMSAQVPMNMAITGGMLAFYRSAPAVVFWQWINQSFNAIVNYTNRSGEFAISTKELLTSYVFATGAALTTAISLNSLVKSKASLVGRFVPFAAVVAANCINIPMMRIREIRRGIPVHDHHGNRLGNSRQAAREGIFMVVVSRISMAAPGMILTPVIIDALSRRKTLQRYPWLNAPLQILICGFILTFTTPLCCALFPQKSSLPLARAEKDIQEAAKNLPHPVTHVYYNKGL